MGIMNLLRSRSRPDVARLEAARDVDGLIQLVTPEPDEDLAWRAAEALGRIGDRHAVRPLLRALDHENERVRAAAQAALDRIEGGVVAAGRPG